MKKLIYLVLFTLFVASCNQEKEAPLSATLSDARLSVASTGDFTYVATDAVDFQNALNEACRIPIGKIIIGADEITGTFTSNMKWKCKSRTVEITGGTINGSLVRTTPKDMSEAVNGPDNFYRYSINVHDVMFTGPGNGLQLNCMYSPVIFNNQFEYKDTGVVLTFVLNADIRNNRFTNCKKVGICGKPGVGTITGAGLSTSASNNMRMIGNRIFNATGSFAGVVTIAASGVVFEDHISEGGQPNYHIYNDGLNNTTSWFYTINRTHIESKATISSIYSKERQMIMRITNPYFQYQSNMLDVQSYAGAIQVNIDGLTWIPSGSTLSSTGNVRWSFTNLYPNLDVTTSTYWKGGTFPSVIYQEKLINTGLEVKQLINGKIKV